MIHVKRRIRYDAIFRFVKNAMVNVSHVRRLTHRAFGLSVRVLLSAVLMLAPYVAAFASVSECELPCCTGQDAKPRTTPQFMHAQMYLMLASTHAANDGIGCSQQPGNAAGNACHCNGACTPPAVVAVDSATLPVRSFPTDICRLQQPATRFLALGVPTPPPEVI